MKISTTFIAVCHLFFMCKSQAVEINEKTRLWTLDNGKTAHAKLVNTIGTEDIDIEDKIVLSMKGKNHTYRLSDFSKKDRDYVRGVIDKLPRGKLEEYPPKFTKKQDEDFYEQHNLASLRWQAKHYEKMPLMINQPRIVGSEKLPVIIYLHGTGGMGTGNVKPLFNDGNGVAKKLFDTDFQKEHPCYVIIPQVEKHSAWFCGHFTDPSREQLWLKNALRLIAEDKRFSIDLDRIYIMGLSMGGHGVYEAVAKIPNFYAGGVAIAAVDDGQSLRKDNCGTPLWVILNKGDKAETVEELKHFAAKYRKYGGNIKITINDKGGHNAWDQALGDKKFISMLFRQKKR